MYGSLAYKVNAIWQYMKQIMPQNTHCLLTGKPELYTVIPLNLWQFILYYVVAKEWTWWCYKQWPNDMCFNSPHNQGKIHTVILGHVKECLASIAHYIFWEILADGRLEEEKWLWKVKQGNGYVTWMEVLTGTGMLGSWLNQASNMHPLEMV